MFVLAVGLLGVAALIPAGRYEIAQGSRLDNAAMIGRASFRDLQIRGYLNPGNATGTTAWRTVGGDVVWDPLDTRGVGTSPAQPFIVEDAAGTQIPSAQVAVVIDPLGMRAIAVGGGTGTYFPYNALATDPHLTRIRPIIPSVANPPPEIWDIVFRSSIDLTIQDNQGEPFNDQDGDGRYDTSEPYTDGNGNGIYDGPNSDLPPQQAWFRDTASLPNALRRASEGNYSWLATIISDPTTSALASKATVSVAVFHKRLLSGPGAGENIADVGWPSAVVTAGRGISGGDVLFTDTAGNPFRAVRPGEWLMLAGRNTTLNIDYYRWYRVVAAREKVGTTQNVTLAGADWDPDLITTGITKAFLFENIVAVYEKNISLEIE